MRDHIQAEDRTPAGLRMPVHRVTDERLTVALRMLQLTVREAAALPVRQQEALRAAVLAIEDVQQWRKHHGSGL